MVIIRNVGVSRYADRLNELDINWLNSVNCKLWFRGKTTTDFPIIPVGVTATPSSNWGTSLSLANGRQVVTFNGTGSYVGLTANIADLFPYAGDFTCSVWVYLGDNRSIFPVFAQNNNGNASTQIYLDATNNSNARIIILCSNSAGTTTAYYKHSLASPYWALTTWTMVTVVRSGSTCLMYINAQSKSVDEMTPWGTITDPGFTNYIGKLVTNYWLACMKDLIILKGTALSADQITWLYNTTKKYLVNV
jgi:hypothetical protein